jgi:methanogenic corrinoid protein MtbC1
MKNNFDYKTLSNPSVEEIPMTNDNDHNQLSRSLAELDEGSVERIMDRMLLDGVAPLEIIHDLTAGMEDVSRLYKEEEYALGELIYAGVIFKNAMNRTRPYLKNENVESRGTVVMGTVKGDIHDLGKNIVIMLLECHGFRVIDLGVDVPKEQFVNAVQQSGAKLLGMSALLTTALPEMQEVIRALGNAGLRDQVCIMIGGATTSGKFGKEIGADFYGRDAVEGVNIAKLLYHAEDIS